MQNASDRNDLIKSVLQYHQQRIQKIKDAIEPVRIVRSELGEIIILYKLLVRDLSEGVDTHVSIKCEENSTVTLYRIMDSLIQVQYKKALSDQQILLRQLDHYPFGSTELRNNPPKGVIQNELTVNLNFPHNLTQNRVASESKLYQT